MLVLCSCLRKDRGRRAHDQADEHHDSATVSYRAPPLKRRQRELRTASGATFVAALLWKCVGSNHQCDGLHRRDGGEM
jgi:hypothetical protein